jgi:hypothetical protein
MKPSEQRLSAENVRVLEMPNRIPEEWIKNYADEILAIASKLPEGPNRDAVALRAEHAMDLLKAYRESIGEFDYD